MGQRFTIEELIKDIEPSEEQGNSKESHIRKIVRGIVKKEISNSIQKRVHPFPVKQKKVLSMVDYYVIRRKPDLTKEAKESIVQHSKLMHKKEMLRIKKAFKTIEDNVTKEIPMKAIAHTSKIADFMKLLWLHEEFFIAKDKIRRHIYSFVVFFPECKEPPAKRKSS